MPYEYFNPRIQPKQSLGKQTYHAPLDDNLKHLDYLLKEKELNRYGRHVSSIPVSKLVTLQ